jgi:RHS repeat-associated protein
LGSIVAVTDASGTLTSQQRYLPFGQVRADITGPQLPITDLGYTGQRSLGDDLGLMDYRARFYSPYLNRFIQPDNIVPGAANPQAMNRYSYTLNNPIRYNDPSGHCPEYIPTEIFILMWCGEVPDYIGILRAVPLTSDIRVAAAIAVQSQWYSPLWDSHLAYPGLWVKAKLQGGSVYSSSGFGFGQISDEEMEDFGLIPVTQELPWVAAKAMEKRIEDVLEACEDFTCTAEDKFIATALAQNRSIDRQKFKDLLRAAKGGGIKWESYFSDREKSGGDGGILDFRAEGYGEGQGGFATRFMLRLYINDTLALEKLGYELPYGLTRDQLIDIRDKYANIQ